MRIMPVDKITALGFGVTGADLEKLVKLISSALSVAIDVVGADVVGLSGGTINLAASAATQSVNALLSAASVKCHLAAPPEDIAVRLTGAGHLVYRCYHSPAHEWDLTGNPRP